MAIFRSLIPATLLLLLVVGCVPVDTSNLSLAYMGETRPGNEPTVFAPGLISQPGRFEMGFAISPDGRTMAFGVRHETDPAQTHLYFLTESKGKWSAPDAKLLPGNTNTFFPMFSPDGMQFFFSKADETGNNDLWVAQYVNGQFSQVRSLGPQVNSSEREAGHGIDTEGRFYFTSNRDDRFACCGDIFEARVQNGQYAEVQKVEVLNSEADEESLYLSPKGDFIIIQAWKSEFESKHDLYISYRRANNQWTTPVRLGNEINGPEIEQRPFVTADGQYLFFSRMSIEEKAGEILFDSDIYWVSTQKVFGPYVYSPGNLKDVEMDQPFSFDLTSNMFRHATQDSLSIRVNQVNGDPLPESIAYNPETHELAGKINAPIELSIEATDSDGQSVTNHFRVTAKY